MGNRSIWSRRIERGTSIYHAHMAALDFTIQRGGIYVWKLIVTKPGDGALPKIVAEKDFWAVNAAKAWSLRFAAETAIDAEAQPGAKGARRKSAARAEAPRRRERKA